jgi:lipoprotein-anchoring transpeptidase ErfK/SrfK
MSLSRRDFLKFSGVALGSLALTPRVLGHSVAPSDALGMVRVTRPDGIDLYDQPEYPRYNDKVKVVSHLDRDRLVYFYEKFEAETGPEFNPTWYKLDEGYAHTAYLQPVKFGLNEVAATVREEGEIYEVTVPFTQSYQQTSQGWEKLYRLYFQSTHWVTGIETGLYGSPWYRILDDLLHVEYFAPASHFRRIPASELTPVSTRVDPNDKRVEVSIAEQRLWAYEEGEVVLDTKISTGIPGLASTNGIPTYTPTGNHVVFSKMPVRHMGDGRLTSDLSAYELPGVPWVSYFHKWGVAFHGTYWHDNYGNEMSHGCVNMKPDEAKWLFRWLLPVASHQDMETRGGNGTLISVV